MRRTILGGLVLMTAACAARTTPLPRYPYVDPDGLEKGAILHLETGRLLEARELLDWAAAFRVVFVGESHDSVDDHAVELALLEGLHAHHGEALGLGLEMLRPSAQAAADAYVRGELDEAGFEAVWAKSWGPDTFAYYAPLLRFARDKGIPLVALNLERELLRKVMMAGLEGLDEETRAALPELELDDPYHRAVVEAVWAGHGAGSAGAEKFHQVQVLWDEQMAESVARWIGAGPERRMLVLAGGYHVRWGIGIPRRFFRRTAAPYAIVLPWTVEIPKFREKDLMDITLPELPLPPADVVWAVGYDDLPGKMPGSDGGGE